MNRRASLSRILGMVLLGAVVWVGCSILPRSAYADSLITNASTGIGTTPCSNSGSGTVSCNVNSTDPDALGTAAAEATGSLANMTMGTLAILGTTPDTPFQDPHGTNEGGASASAELIYNFTDLPASLNGGTLVFTISIDGTSGMTCSGFCAEEAAGTGLSLPGANLATGPTEGFLGLGAGSATVGLPVGLTTLQISTDVGGGVSNLSLELFSSVQCEVFNGATCSASTDYLDPLAITGVEAFDSSGNAVSGVPIISESGVNFSTGVTATPEPSSILMLGFGLATLCGMSFRRKHRKTVEALAM